ncbi:hypothetical protein ADL01_13005 [Streptomyces sp. NRRL WC-3618]|nr:hypothetical protein ADL01_13005 [Streptomyces sp. NRRL WC-3618]
MLPTASPPHPAEILKTRMWSSPSWESSWSLSCWCWSSSPATRWPVPVRRSSSPGGAARRPTITTLVPGRHGRAAC